MYQEILYTQLTHVLLISRKGAKGQSFSALEASRLGYIKLAMIAACFASARARREIYATLKF